MQQRIFAVEAPDGESDANLWEELDEVKHIIDDAAALENKEASENKHRREEDVQKYHGMFRAPVCLLMNELVCKL